MGLGRTAAVGAGFGLVGAGFGTKWIVDTKAGESSAARMQVASMVMQPLGAGILAGVGAFAAATVSAPVFKMLGKSGPYAGSFGIGAGVGLAALVGASLIDRIVHSDTYSDNTDAATSGIENARAGFLELGLDAGETPPVSYQRIYPNAGYHPTADKFIIGTDVRSGVPYAQSDEVLRHEYGHRIINHYAPDLIKNKPDGGVLHESIADSFAAFLGDDWRIGDDAGGSAIRDMEDPQSVRDAAGRIPPAHRSQKYGGEDGNGEPHLNAGIPNHATFLMAEAIGKPAVAEIYAEAVRSKLNDADTIRDWADDTYEVALDMHGGASTEAAAVKDAWAAVGYIVGD